MVNLANIWQLWVIDRPLAQVRLIRRKSGEEHVESHLTLHIRQGGPQFA